MKRKIKRKMKQKINKYKKKKLCLHTIYLCMSITTQPLILEAWAMASFTCSSEKETT